MARVLLFPCAGAGPAAFRGWASLFGAVDAYAVHLPGRESRIGEPAECTMTSIVSALVGALASLPRLPTVLVGHSMGALIAFELAHALASSDPTLVHALVVSACAAPHVPDPLAHLGNLSDRELVAAMERLNGTDPEVLKNPELLALVLPILRADFNLMSAYECAPRSPLSVSLVAIAARRDAGAPVETVAEWRRHTRGRFALRVVDGDHFFIAAAPQLVTARVQEEIDTIAR